MPVVVPGRVVDSQRALEPRAGLLRDVLDELRWTLSGRKGWLLGIAGNLALAYAYLAVTQPNPQRLGDIAAANVGLAVVVWCLSDVVNTNQLGSDGDRVAASLEVRDSVARILVSKNLALAIMLVPLAFAISVVHWIWEGRFHHLVHTAVYDIGSVFLWLGMGSVVSVLLPFRPLSIRARLKARSTWLRYGLCQAAPYVAYGIVWLLRRPYHILYSLAIFGQPHGNFTGYALLYLGIGFAYWGVGLWLASLYGRHAPARLITDLHRSG
jgi:hypothetical protein